MSWLQAIYALWKLVGLLRDLLAAYEKAEASRKRARLDAALDRLEQAKTAEERKDALRDIARDSF